MANKLIKRNTILAGSPADIARREGTGLAEALYANMALIILGDNSGSMEAMDVENGPGEYLTREQKAMQELANLYEQYPGKALLIEFSNFVNIRPNGTFSGQHGGTDLTAALRFLRDVGIDQIPDIKVVVISDGHPDDPATCLKVAKQLGVKLNTIYCGPSDGYMGLHFLNDLANASGGRATTVENVDLEKEITHLLTEGAT
jgi:hypothetical protein